MMNKKFDSIPKLKIKDGKFTIINEGTGSMGSSATYECSKEGIIEVVEQPRYHHYMQNKFGYTFKGLVGGELYLLILENDYGDLAYADIYNVSVYDDLSLEVAHVENIDIYWRISIQEFIDYIADKYGFTKSMLEEKYRIYLER